MGQAHDQRISAQSIARLISRRGFLCTAAATAVAGAAGGLGTPALAAVERRSNAPSRDRVPRERISVQLYTLRDQLAIDFEGTLAALSEIGYTRVEHAGFVGRTVAAFKTALDAHGLWASSGHVGIPQPFDETAWSAALADAQTLESRYIVHPFFGIDFGSGEVARTTATWRAFADDLNRAGEMAKEAGLRLGYHNHNWEFFRLTDDPSRTAYDVLTAETDRRLVHLEVDIFWAWRGATDPVDLINANRGRVLQFHVKDMKHLLGDFEDPGQGLVDFPRIFAHSRRAGLEEYIVERDDGDGTETSRRRPLHGRGRFRLPRIGPVLRPVPQHGLGLGHLGHQPIPIITHLGLDDDRRGSDMQRPGGGDHPAVAHGPEEVGLRLDGRGPRPLGQVEQGAGGSGGVGQGHDGATVQHPAAGAQLGSPGQAEAHLVAGGTVDLDAELRAQRHQRPQRFGGDVGRIHRQSRQARRGRRRRT